MKELLTLIGLVMVVEGLSYFIAPERVQTLARIMSETSPSKLRIIGLGLMLTGLLAVAVIRLWLFPGS